MPTVYDKYGQSEFGGALSPCYKHVSGLLSEAKVLDIASGDGTYLRHFGKNSMGIDISDPNIELCTKMNISEGTWYQLNEDEKVYCKPGQYTDIDNTSLLSAEEIKKVDDLNILDVPKFLEFELSITRAK